MAGTASLLVDRKPGTLLRAVSALIREGLYVEANRISENLGGELARVVLSIAGEFDPNKLRLVLIGVSGVVEVESIQLGETRPVSGRTDDADAVERIYQEIVKKPNNAGGLLLALERQIPAEHWAQISRKLGARLGQREFKRNYSLGLPLPFDSALKRMVVPALKPFGKAKVVAEGLVQLNECSICSGLSSTVPICHFISGFIEGLLTDSAPTKGAVVTEAQCRSAGSSVGCEFSVTLP
jgi:hypothetical protein